MNFQSLFFNTLVDRIGMALVHFLWQGAAIAVVLAVALRILRQRSPLARYRAAWAALVAMTFCLPITAYYFPSAPRAEMAVLTALPNQDIAPKPPVDRPVKTARNVWEPNAREKNDTESTEFPERAVVVSSRGAARDSSRIPLQHNSPAKAGWSIASFARPLQRVLPWIVGVWLFGAMTLAVWHLGGFRHLVRLQRLGTAPPPAEIEQVVFRLSSRLGIRRSVSALVSHIAQVPTVLGWLRPVILLPASILGQMPPEQLEMILAHELAHVRRLDYLWNLLQIAAETLLFYHPAVWWVSRRIREERENCCDRQAVAAMGNPLVYAGALTRLAEIRCRLDQTAAPASSIAADGGSLEFRIRRVLGLPVESACNSNAWLGGVLAALILAAVFSVNITWAESKPSDDKELPSGKTTAPASTPVSGDKVQSQPAGSLDVSNQAQLSAYGLSALTGNATTDPAKFQAILTYVGGLAASSPLRTLWIPTGIWYVDNASLTVNKGPLTLVGQSKTGSVLRRPVISTGFMLPMLSSGGTAQNPAWASTASALGSAASGTVTAVSGDRVTVAGGNFADYVGRTVYDAHGLPLSPPSTAPTLALSSASHSVTNGTHYVAVTYVTQGGNPGYSDSETTIGKAASITVTNNDEIAVTVPIGPPDVLARNIYMTKAGTTTPYYCVTKSLITINDNKTTTYAIHLSDAALAKVAWPPYQTNCAVLPNYASGKITAGGSGTFTAALSGGLLSNTWKVGDHYDVEVDSPPLTVENLTLDGNWPAQWFMVGTNANTVAGATVVDNSKTFTGQLGALAKNVTQNLGHTPITAVTTHSFTTAGAPGFPGVTWKPGDQYALDRGSEFANLLSLYAASSTPGRLTANISNVNFINERDSRGICLENNVNLRASHLYGANIGCVICAVESFCNMQVTGMSGDGIGTAAATVGGIRIPGLSDAPYYYEVDPDAEGYSRGKYNSRSYPYAGAPNNFTLSDIRLSNLDCLEQNPAGLYCVNHYHNITATGTTGWIFFWDGDTDSTTIENSRFNSGFYSGNYQYAVQFQPGTELIENTAFLGLKNPKYGTGGDLYHIAAIGEYPGGKIPYSITFTNDTFDVDSSVTKGGFPGIGAMCCNWSNNTTSGNTLNLKGGSVSANVVDAVVNAQVCNIDGTTFHNTGYLWRQVFYSTNAARMPWTLNITNPFFGKGSGKYLGINSQGSLAYKLAVTQTNVVLPVAYSRMDIATASATWPSGITVNGRKTIIGPTTTAPTNVCAFGDDLLGAGKGDYYQDAATGYIHQFRCTHTCWYDGSTFRINGGGGSAWTQVR